MEISAVTVTVYWVCMIRACWQASPGQNARTPGAGPPPPGRGHGQPAIPVTPGANDPVFSQH